MDTYSANVPQEAFACVGVRSMQRMRRSQSTSGMIGKARTKVAAAVDYLNAHGLETGALAMKFLACSTGGLGLDLQEKAQSLQHKKSGKTALRSKSTPKIQGVNALEVRMKSSRKQPGDKLLQPGPVVKLLQPNPVVREITKNTDNHDAQNALAVAFAPPAQPGRFTFYCKEIYAFEEFYSLTCGDLERFDDEGIQAMGQGTFHEEYRTFFGMEIHSYEEFYCLVGGDHEHFDDEVLHTKSGSSCSSRSFYCMEIHSYEEFFNLVGGDHEQFDDEIFEANSSRTDTPRSFYSQPISSYEEFYILVGGDHEVFDDVYKPIISTGQQECRFHCL